MSSFKRNKRTTTLFCINLILFLSIFILHCRQKTEIEMARLAQIDILQMNAAPSIEEEDLEIDRNLSREFQFLQNIDKIPADANWDRIRESFDHKTLFEVSAQAEDYRLNEFDYSKQ